MTQSNNSGLVRKIRLCSIEGCENKHTARGWCHKHYMSYRDNGHPLAIKYARPNSGEPMKYLLSQFERDTDECFTWPFSKDPSGHGRMNYQEYNTGVHRIVMLILHGEPPEDKPHAIHKCLSPECFNPRHLEWGSAKQNALDRRRDGTQAVGEAAAHSARLTKLDVLAIREDKRSDIVIGKEYGVVPSAIYNIKHRNTWSWL